jgi:hypothetical protein
MPDWIPSSTPDVIALAGQVATGITTGVPTNYGSTAAIITALTTAATAAQTALTGRDAAAVTLDAAQATLDTAVTTLVTQLRAVNRTAQGVPGITVARLTQGHLPVHDTTQTEHTPPPTRPVLVVDASQRMRHTIGFADEGTPTKKAKPFGVNGCEIWFKVGGPPPTDWKQCAFLALDSQTPYVADWTAAEAGQTIHYMGRWKVGNGYGPWSETVSVTLGA